MADTITMTKEQLEQDLTVVLVAFDACKMMNELRSLGKTNDEMIQYVVKEGTDQIWLRYNGQ